MKKTVVITGSSSGIGRETALYFSEKGWNVVATMRKPEERKTELHEKEGIDIVHLDVTDLKSIKDAIQYATDRYGRIDVLVNNAGYGTLGPFEASTREQVEKQYKTNVIGLMDITREILPVFRKQNGGYLINVASVGGRTTFPLYSVYNSTKWAVEGFSEGIHWELRQFNIRVKIIEPGMIKTDFSGRSMDILEKEDLDAYDDFVASSTEKMGSFEAKGSHPRVVAETIYKAANDKSWRLRYRAGGYSGAILTFRKILPDRVFFRLVRSFTLE